MSCSYVIGSFYSESSFEGLPILTGSSSLSTRPKNIQGSELLNGGLCDTIRAIMCCVSRCTFGGGGSDSGSGSGSLRYIGGGITTPVLNAGNNPNEDLI